MFRYETHLHTFPVSRCGKATVQQVLDYYKSLNYDGIFITNHFINSNINFPHDRPYRDRIEFFYSDYEEACRLGADMGIKVFSGVEMAYDGTDFLVYGLEKEWYLAHPEIMEMKMTTLLPMLMEEGALVVQAHPFREASYIDHIRLFPRSVQGVEIINACRTEEENAIARYYADHYGLLHFAGSDNHHGEQKKDLAGMESETPVTDAQDFVKKVLSGQMRIFKLNTGERNPD